MHSSSRRHRKRDRDRAGEDPSSSTGIYTDPTTPSNRLTRAITNHDVPLVRRLLATAVNPDGSRLDPRNPDPVTGKTSLMVAAEVGNLDMCRMLLKDYGVEEHGISRDLDGQTVLHIAASHDFLDIAGLYATGYPDTVDWPNADGATALHIASQNGYDEMVALLLDSGADVELTDHDGNTALHYASAWGHLRCVLVLIERDCPVYAKNNVGFTASDHAFSFSLQTALNESGKAHYEAQKQLKRAQQRKERHKEGKTPRSQSQNALPTTANGDQPPHRGMTTSASEDVLHPPSLASEAMSPSRSASLPIVGRTAASPSTPSTPNHPGGPVVSPSPTFGSVPRNVATPPTIRTSSSFTSDSGTNNNNGGGGGLTASRLFPAAASRLIPFSLTPSRRGARSRTDSGASSFLGAVPPSPSHSSLGSPTGSSPNVTTANLRPRGPGTGVGSDGRDRAESTSSEKSSLTTGSGGGRSTPLGNGTPDLGRGREVSSSGSGSDDRSPAGAGTPNGDSPEEGRSVPGGLPVLDER